jgi:hypothetical protein
MRYQPLLDRIRFLVPTRFDEHYQSVRKAFEDQDLTAPRIAVSDIELARAISEFTSVPPNEASIATLEIRLNPKY